MTNRICHHVAAVILAVALSSPAEAKRWGAAVIAGTPPATVTCDDVRWAVRIVGVETARQQARLLGMTWAQERRAAACLKGIR